MKYTFLGRDGHGKRYYGSKDNCIRITDRDLSTDFIAVDDGYSEREAVLDYFKNWKLSNSMIDYLPVLIKTASGYEVADAMRVGGIWDDEIQEYNLSKIENLMKV